MRTNKFISHLPNFITFTNMLLGITVLLIILCGQGENHRFVICILICVAALLDALDGMTARALKAESKIGKQLDSFADLISFGLAPVAIFLTHESFRVMGLIMYVCFAFYISAAAFRLARYNIGDYKDFFLGLPITVAGCILVFLNLILHFLPVTSPVPIVIILILICVLSVLMISRIKIQRIGKKRF